MVTSMWRWENVFMKTFQVCVASALTVMCASAVAETPISLSRSELLSEVQNLQPPSDWNRTPQQYRVAQVQSACLMQGVIFKTAASARSQGMPPKMAYQLSAVYVQDHLPGITPSFVKNAVNHVYFDPRFASAGGQTLADQMQAICMNDGKPIWQPLQ